jgi:hypothetical protein
MSAMPSPKHYEIFLPVKRSATARAFRMAGGEGDWFAGPQPPHGKPTSRSRFLMMFFLGAIATLAWQSYSHAAREIIAGLSPQLRWLAPQAVADAPDKIEQITHGVDRIAGDIMASHDQITRSIDHLAAGQEQMTLEIIRLQAIVQFAPSRKEDHPPQTASASAPVRKASQRSLQAR